MLTNIKEVKDLISVDRYTSIIWYSNDCDVCEYFLDDIKNIEGDLPNWKIAYICAEEYNQEIFEPILFPTTFIFKDGQRIFVGPGQVPYKEVLKVHKDIESGQFKSQEDLEKEQLKELTK